MYELLFLMIPKRFQSNCKLQWAMHEPVSKFLNTFQCLQHESFYPLAFSQFESNQFHFVGYFWYNGLAHSF
jgi:hypothetical protein